MVNVIPAVANATHTQALSGPPDEYDVPPNATGNQLQIVQANREQFLQSLLGGSFDSLGERDRSALMRAQYNIATNGLYVRLPRGAGPDAPDVLGRIRSVLAANPRAAGWVDQLAVIRQGSSTPPATWQRGRSI